ncbi:major facilitator superfamily domain-containing protein 8-like isoform X2 [Antedon mediterranea]
MYLTIFTEAVTYSVILPSIWSYILDIDETATATLLGWANSTQGLFALLAGFICGWTAGRYNCKVPVTVTLIVGLMANILYMCVYIPESHQITALIAARALAGIQAGCITVTRVYISEGTTLKERTQISSNLVIAQLIGYTVGPLLQVAYVPIGETGWTVGKLKINVYTFPAITNLFIIFINLIFVIFVFREIRVPDEPDQHASKPDTDCCTEYQIVGSEGMVHIDISSIDLPLVMFLNAVYCVTIFSFGYNTTIVSPYGMHLLGWSREEAVEKSGIIALSLAILSIFVIAAMGRLLERFKDRVFLAIGIIMMIMCTTLAIPMGPGVPPRPDINMTTNSSDDGQGGCPWTYSWCDTTPSIAVAQYIVSLSVLGFGYPILQAITYIIYCKTLGPNQQGLFLGIFGAMGNTGRVVGPLLGTFIYTEFGVQWAEGCLLALLTIVATGVFPFYKRMVPYTVYQKKCIS